MSGIANALITGIANMKKHVTSRILLGVSLSLTSLVVVAQMAPIQLTNPAVDSISGSKPAAWIADENMGVLYCELVTSAGDSQRVACFDSNGPVTISTDKPLPR